MPIYEYRCKECKRNYEETMSFKDEIPESIPCECGRLAKKIFSIPFISTKKEKPVKTPRKAAKKLFITKGNIGEFLRQKDI